MDITRKLKTAMTAQNVTQTELANRTSQSQKTLSAKMIANNFRINEFERLITALGCELELNIVLPDGRKI